ncbi:serine/threonine-protein kinase [Gemmatimonas phototrophica]|uniref:serine/threonine-protein kinase n=1 Tax=Gemmatimonas phototrophica TaxID=1379270 RepID=UPI0006A6E6AB|nr:serine/threonine-protein kinase [Gemmatimonas phototrophica]
MPKVCPVCGASYSDANVFCPADGSTLRAADSDGDLIGSVVADRYLVTDLLGEGGMGKVYLARHVRLPQQAAIKVLRAEMLKDPAAVARFNREAANACRIEHERVARVFDFGETSEGLVYLAMEYVPGDALKDVLRKDGPLPLARTATIVRQIADGLDAAHRLGIVHRDLKPDNILVTKDEVDGSDKCKVVDFGIAKAMGGNEKESGLTKTGFVVGTPEFMSPEQLLGTELDQRSDVYALALVAYQCLTCDLPFDTNTPDRGMTARLMSAPRTLETVKPNLSWPRELQRVFDRALDKTPAKRTATAGTFAREFEAAITTPAAQATPAAATPALDPSTPGAARMISTFDKSLAPKPAKPTPSKPKKVTAPTPRPSKGTPAVTAPVDDEPRATRSFRLPRIPLPSLGLVLVAAAGWWWFTKQRAPRPSDLNRLLNSATQTAGSVMNSAQNAADAASNAVSTVGSEQAGTIPAGTTPVPGAPAAGGSPAAPAGPAAGATTAPAPTGSTPAGTPSGGAVSPGAASARTTLDSITKSLDPTDSSDEQARAAISTLRSIILRLPTSTDSTWAYIRIAEAYLIVDELKPACAALRSARGVARSMNQAEVINRYFGTMGCAQQ